ncbi:hypothetical protein [Sphingobacterium sp. UME9]|uniref:hypothetical protein n=1 Tax=Sphingobacterium sp. UME9 TaxID=1862316 RepID=UPI0015FF9D0F|nr:hypothetical protein [Sphingobacterium sp. UME9]MBB1646802.1 hypothetical protein [Sphingobacterium sp. UME9]
MKPKCNYILALERTLYDVHGADYDPLKDIEAFWKQYSIGLITNNIIELQPKVNSEALSGFSLDLLRALAAYLIAHVSNVDLSKIGVSEFLKVSKEELQLTKEISDFFQRVSPSNPNF